MKTNHLLSRFFLLTGFTLLAFVQHAKAQAGTNAPDAANFENATIGGPIIDNNGALFGINGGSTTGSTWSIVNGSGNLPTQVLQNVSSGGNSYADLRFYNLQNGTETGFTETTDFAFTSVTTPGSSYTNVGFGAASSNSIFYGNGNLAEFVIGSSATSNAAETAGNLIITNDFGNGSSQTLTSIASGLTPTAGDKYTLSLTGIYNYSGSSPALNLYLSITDDTSGISSGIVTATLAGANAAYGVYGLAANTSAGSATVDFDNFSMALATNAPAVPEPSSWVLLGLGLFAVGMRLRRIES